jgi:hypothetical protein
MNELVISENLVVVVVQSQSVKYVQPLKNMIECHGHLGDF